METGMVKIQPWKMVTTPKDPHIQDIVMYQGRCKEDINSRIKDKYKATISGLHNAFD